MRTLSTRQQKQANQRSYDFKRRDRKINPKRYADYNREYNQNHPERGLWSRAKKRAKAKGLSFRIALKNILIPSRCPILGIPIFMGTKTICDNSPSLDRINNNRGYIPGNVQVISAKANVMKSNATPKQLRSFALWVRRVYGA